MLCAGSVVLARVVDKADTDTAHKELELRPRACYRVESKNLFRIGLVHRDNHHHHIADSCLDMTDIVGVTEMKIAVFGAAHWFVRGPSVLSKF